MLTRRHALGLLAGSAFPCSAQNGTASGTANLPQFPYGAVYFRKSNPPREDWERDYARAAADGYRTFRHWFMWGSIEVAPGQWDWDDYDRQFDLAAKHGIRTVIGEVAHSAPEWAFRELAHARFETAEGRKVGSSLRNSSATAGFPGLCLDNEDARARAEAFLTQLVTRYREHASMAAYDVWNECNLTSSGMPYCFCPATVARFREWLRAKYGGVTEVARAWRRYSFATWDDVLPPRNLEAYPEQLDWTTFRIENAFRLMKWRTDLIRRLDPAHPLTAHGVNDKPLTAHVLAAHDPWRAAALVDVYGYTGGSAQEDRINNNWRRWCMADLTRAGCDGKPFWAAEMAAFGSWEAKAGLRENGRIPQPHDLRVANFIGMGGGATGIFSSRWRGLLDGPLFGAYAFYDLDGSPTPNSAMGSNIARWANAPTQTKLWRSRPVRGDVGIVVISESQIHATLRNDGNSDHYAFSAEGAYRAFFDANIQADWVHLDHIDRYELLYLPYPVMLPVNAARKLGEWVRRGGHLVSEGAPGYFDDTGRAGVRQPNLGLDELFGARQTYVEFAPDLADKLTFRTEAHASVLGGVNQQVYAATKGTAAGWYADGRVAVVDHAAAKGKTRLIGTHPGYGYYRHREAASREFFAGLLAWAGKTPHVGRTGADAIARVHDGPGGTCLWIVNHRPERATVQLTLSPKWGPFRAADVLWGADKPMVDQRVVNATVPPVDALVVRLS